MMMRALGSPSYFAVKVAFDLLGAGESDSVQAITTFKEMQKSFPCLAKIST